jgi:hypothetical protein
VIGYITNIRMVRIQDFFKKYLKERDCLKGFGKDRKSILTFKHMG